MESWEKESGLRWDYLLSIPQTWLKWSHCTNFQGHSLNWEGWGQALALLIRPRDHPFSGRKWVMLGLEFALNRVAAAHILTYGLTHWFPGGLSTTCDLIPTKVNGLAFLCSSAPHRHWFAVPTALVMKGRREREEQWPLQSAHCTLELWIVQHPWEDFSSSPFTVKLLVKMRKLFWVITISFPRSPHNEKVMLAT